MTEIGSIVEVIRTLFPGGIVTVTATQNPPPGTLLPAEACRLHLCWGNYEGPHTHDIGLEKIIEVILKAKPMAISFEASNPRHAHEWEVWRDTKLPDDKVLIPGVIDSATNFVEHPRLVAQRIEQFAALVGRERVIAGVDCGFATFAGFGKIDPAICYAKLKTLSEGAALSMWTTSNPTSGCPAGPSEY